MRSVAFRERRDPLNHPAFVLAIAPKAGIRTLADLRGKRIAFSPSQVQGQIVLQTLKALGLTKRDDAVLAYVPLEVLRDPAKAAALKTFVHYWGRAQAWALAHPDELARGYYVGHQGLSLAEAKLIVASMGETQVTRGWDQPVAYQQAAIDLLAPEMNKPRFDAETLFDRRFETIAGDGFDAQAANTKEPR
uniref:ABC transporter substrate-binding protein n=1 Tax=uncultured Sphingomonas sp. TaxID=158754 RepID=UPI0035CA1485